MAIAQISQGPKGSLRIKMHDKHAALVSIGKHLGMFTDIVQMKAVYGVSDKPMSAEEWKSSMSGKADDRRRPMGMAAAGRAAESARRLPGQGNLFRRHARRRQDGWRAGQVGAQREALGL